MRDKKGRHLINIQKLNLHNRPWLQKLKWLIYQYQVPSFLGFQIAQLFGSRPVTPMPLSWGSVTKLYEGYHTQNGSCLR